MVEVSGKTPRIIILFTQNDECCKVSPMQTRFARSMNNSMASCEADLGLITFEAAADQELILTVV